MCQKSAEIGLISKYCSYKYANGFQNISEIIKVRNGA